MAMAETNWADAFNNTINAAKDSYGNLLSSETQQQRNELLSKNTTLNINPTTGNIQPAESKFSTRNILLYAGIAVAGFMLYKFAKKNKYI